MQRMRKFAAGLGAVLAAAMWIYAAGALLAGSPSLEPAAFAQQEGQVPGGSLGGESDADIWRAVRGGIQGTVSIPDKQAGVLIQSEGENWRAARNGPLSLYGAWGMLGVIAVLALFFPIRGRPRHRKGRRDGKS